jgi:AcrR family transcriptional regulator
MITACERSGWSAWSIVTEQGSAMRIADVARSLGLTRQTVHRYFPGTEALLLTTAMRSGNGFLDQFANHVRGETDSLSKVAQPRAGRRSAS